MSEQTPSLDQFFELSLDMLSMINFSGHFLRINPAFQKTLGYSLPELLSRPFIEFVHPDDRPATLLEMEKLSIAGENTLDFKNRYICSDGSIRTLSWRVVPVAAEKTLYCIARDVTQEQLDLAAAREQTDKTILFQKTLLRMRDFESRDLPTFFRQITESCAGALDTDFVGIWLFDNAHKLIRCEDLYTRTFSTHSRGQELCSTAYPAYFEAISSMEPILATDAQSHPAFSELADTYLKPANIISTMDIPLRAGGNLAGVICCEQANTPRKWTTDESKFATSVASYIMVALEQTDRLRAEEEVHRLNTLLERRIAERTAALRDSEERFRLMIEQVEDRAIYMLDTEGRIATWNTGAERAKGYTAEEIIGRSFSCFYTPEDIARDKPHILLSIARDEGHVTEEGWRVRKDGTRFWAEVVLTAIHDDAGTLIGFSKITRDLTERRRAEDALRESEEQFRSAMEHSSIGMSLVDTHGKYLKVNPAVTAILGYSSEELLALDFQSITHPDDVAIDEISRRKMIAGEMSHCQTETRYIHKDGQIIWALVNVSLVRDSLGEPRFFISQVQDITTQKLAAEEARLATQRMQLATQVGRIGIWEVDLTSAITTWDEQMYNIYGLPSDPADTGMDKGHRTMHPEDRAKIAAAFSEVLVNGQRPSNGIEYRIYHGETGELRYIHSKATTLRDDAGLPKRVIGICWDVTEERHREQALSHALAQEKELVRKAQAGEHAKGEFLAVMSHEIRTPINGILGFAEILARSSEIPTEGRDYAQTILDSSETLLRILDDILDYSRMEAGGLRIEKTLLAPQKLVREIGALLAPSARDKGLQIHFDITTGIPDTIPGDAARLRQILLNLGANAIKFTEHGTVTFGLRHRLPVDGTIPAALEFFVRDTGPGIPPDRLEQIFDPFVQADSSTSRRYGGTGLGLTISRRLARLMEGDLFVASALGQGTEFLVRLPLPPLDTAPAPRTSTGDTPEEPLDETFASRHPFTVLVVDDDRVNLKLMLTMIRKLGYTPISAANGASAVASFQSEHPDCILMDLQMPGMDGIEATRKIREIEKNSSLPAAFIFALTANTVPADRERCFRSGMNEYLNKPIRRAALARMLVKASATLRNPAQPA